MASGKTWQEASNNMTLHTGFSGPSHSADVGVRASFTHSGGDPRQLAQTSSLRPAALGVPILATSAALRVLFNQLEDL